MNRIFRGFICLPFFFSASVCWSQNAQEIPARLECGPLSSNPVKRPAFGNSILFRPEGSQLVAIRPTNRRPGTEKLIGEIKDGVVTVRGTGHYYNGASWSFDYRGKLADNEEQTVVKGIQRGPRATRNCSVTFLIPGSELKKYASLPSLPKVLPKAETKAPLKERVTDVERLLGNIILPTTQKADDWFSRVPSVPVQQQQFCKVVDRFFDNLAETYVSRNEIRRNALFRERQRDMSALLPNGRFENWIVRVLEVKQTPTGDAAVLLQPPCRALLASSACEKNGAKLDATIPSSSALFRELAKIGNGDFVVISGEIFYAQEGDGKATSQSTIYAPGSYCTIKDGGQDQDVFITSIEYLVRMQ